MKRLLTTATAIATLAIPALSFAHAYQDQNDARSKNPAPAQTRQPPQRPAPAETRARPERPAPAQPAPRPGHPPPSVVMKVKPPVRVVQRPSWNRGNPNWWRGRPEFRDYAGARPGFWYRPGFGYFRVDPRWYGFSWQIGGFVPVEFRSYYVQNPYDYGLPPPPYGYAYVYLGQNIALMSLASGAIVQVFPNVY